MLIFSCPSFQLRSNSTVCRIPGIPNTPYPDCCEHPGPCEDSSSTKSSGPPPCIKTTTHKDGTFSALG